MKRTTLTISESLLEGLDALARNERRSRSAMLCYLIEKAINPVNPSRPHKRKKAPVGASGFARGTKAHILYTLTLPPETRLTQDIRDDYRTALACLDNKAKAQTP